MSRSEAATYYSDTFGNPEAIDYAGTYARCMLYVVGISLAVVILVFVLSCLIKNDDKTALLVFMVIVFFASRCVVLYYLCWCFSYVN